MNKIGCEQIRKRIEQTMDRIEHEEHMNRNRIEQNCVLVRIEPNLTEQNTRCRFASFPIYHLTESIITHQCHLHTQIHLSVKRSRVSIHHAYLPSTKVQLLFLHGPQFNTVRQVTRLVVASCGTTNKIYILFSQV